MRATYESTKESSIVWVYLRDESETLKAESLVGRMESYGYSLIHVDSGECYMLTGDWDLTTAQMKEDYSLAKKEAA